MTMLSRDCPNVLNRTRTFVAAKIRERRIVGMAASASMRNGKEGSA